MVLDFNTFQPAQFQAGLVITPTFYDKRGLTTTDPLLLLNSLVNLSYISSISTSRVGQLLSSDGLELLVRILNRLANATDNDRTRLSFSAALSCLSNLAVRGSIQFRFWIVEAGIIPALLPLLIHSARGQRI